jgi:hypothetical protein
MRLLVSTVLQKNVMKLPIPSSLTRSFTKSKKEESQYYLSLVLTDEKVCAVVLKAIDTTLQKINDYEIFFTKSIEELPLDDFTNIIDKAISRAEEILPPDIQTHKTVFCVKENWIEQGTAKIKKEYLIKLKKVCSILDLTPIGFMVTTEAVIHLLKEEEGAPLSAIFVEIQKNTMTLKLLRGGKTIETVNPDSIGVSPIHFESIPMTIDTLLSHFSVPVLPARIIVFQSKPDERTSHALLTHQWGKSLPFLHIPQITLLPDDITIKAILSGAASQMGLSVATSSKKAIIEESIANNDNYYESDNLHSSENLITVPFGFVLDKDITDEDVEQKSKIEQTIPISDVQQTIIEEPYISDSSRSTRSKNKSTFPFSETLRNIRLLFSSLPTNFFNGLKGKKTPMKILIPILGIIILLGSLSSFYFFIMQATVTLQMAPQIVNDTQRVTFITNGASDFETETITAKSITASINGQVSTTATGKKDVGEKAKGTITIYNNDNKSIALASGTQLKASNGQLFLLDNDVTVASSSGDIFSGTKPGTTDAHITAKDLGTDGNIPSGTKLDIGGNSTLAAKNDNAFSGGTKKSVTVVSKDDLIKLKTDLPKSVQDEAKKNLTDQASSDQTVLPLISDPVLEKPKYDKALNDEAKTVSLAASVIYTGIAYRKSELDDYAQTIMKKKHTGDVNFADKSIKATVGSAEQKSANSATATIAMEAGLLPKINKQDVINAIKNKSLGSAQETVTNLPQVQSATVTFSPPIPIIPLLFPQLPKKINVEIVTK